MATLQRDPLTIGPLANLTGGIGAISATAASITVNGVDTLHVTAGAGTIDLEASGNLTVAAGTSVIAGAGTITLVAGVNAGGTGNPTGTLAIQARAVVWSASTSASAVTLRGAHVSIDTSAQPALVESGPALSAEPTTTVGTAFSPNALAVDPDGNVFVANGSANTVLEFAAGSSTPTATLNLPGQATALACDQAGDLFVLVPAARTLLEFAPGSTTPMPR